MFGQINYLRAKLYLVVKLLPSLNTFLNIINEIAPLKISK